MKREWIEPGEWPALESGEVHVWLAHVPNARLRLEELRALLSPDERERVARFKFEQHRERSQVARGVLRLLLAHYTGREAGALAFAYNAHGKPELREGGLHFNTSHSGDYVVFAFSHAGPVGVDIEQIRKDMQQHQAIAERHFAPGEQRQLNSLPEGERLRGFFELWARKEAFIKAPGEGVFGGLTHFETALDCERGVTIRGVRASDWWMSALPDVPGYAGAVALNAAACVAKFWKWNWLVGHQVAGHMPRKNPH